MATPVKADKPKGGLEDVVACASAICYLDGERGVLAYCGYDIHDLARGATFEEVCYLLWHRRLPTRRLRCRKAGSPGGGACRWFPGVRSGPKTSDASPPACR